jgi:DNA-binding response OmpR family regulator
MSRVLLVDDSPHAQRMGERILAEEGYEVVTVSNAEAALIRLLDVDPDVIVADTVMPGRSGYDVCQYVKMSPRHSHVGVILTAGVLEKVDESEARRVEADAVLHKPFEASALIAAVRPLAERAQQARSQSALPVPGEAHAVAHVEEAAPFVAVVDAEQVRAAVTVALDASMERMIEEITKHVLAALESQEASRQDAPPASSAPLPLPQESAMDLESSVPEIEESPWPEPVRKVTLLRRRTGSILGLDLEQSSDDEPQE